MLRIRCLERHTNFCNPLRGVSDAPVRFGPLKMRLESDAGFSARDFRNGSVAVLKSYLENRLLSGEQRSLDVGY